MRKGSRCTPVTDALITELGRSSGLRVISLQSIVHLKDSAKALLEIARELGADAIVEGSALHAGDHVRISAQLIRMEPEEHLWAQSYERRMNDVLNIQREIACAIAERVQVMMTAGDLSQRSGLQPVEPEAYEAFLKGGFYMNRWSREGLQKAIEYLEQAVALDPGFAPAWASLASCFCLLGLWGHVPPQPAGMKAGEAARKALALDESLAAAHAVRGWVAWHFDWDFACCERELNRALELNPSELQAHGLLAVFQFVVRGDIGAGVAETREMLRLDPLSMYTSATAAWYLVFAGEWEQAGAQASRAIDRFPDALQAWYALGWAHVGLFRYDEAVRAFERAAAISRDALSISYLGCALARAGQVAAAEALLTELLDRSSREYVPPKALTYLYGGLGDIDRAFEWVEKADRDHDGGSVFPLDVMPGYAPLRADARYGEMLRRLGLPPPRP